MRRRQNVRVSKSLFGIFTVVFAMVVAWQVSIIYKELPQLVEWYVADGYPYTKEQLGGLAESPLVGFYLQDVLPVTEGVLGRTEEMTVRIADAEYYAWSGAELEAGRWPQTMEVTGEAATAGEAAVSYEWALEHYKYLDITGQTLQVGGRTYQISGVYRTKKSWRQQLAGADADIIYLSFSAENVSAGCSMNYLYFQKEGGDFQSNQDYLADVAAKAAGVRVSPDLVLDVESASHVFLQNVVVCVLLWLFVTVLFLRGIGWKVPSCICLALCMLGVLCYQWYIPMAYLQQETIFDLAGYFRTYVQEQHMRDLYQECGYFGNLVQMHAGISWGLLVVLGGMAAVSIVVQAVSETFAHLLKNFEKK